MECLQVCAFRFAECPCKFFMLSKALLQIPIQILLEVFTIYQIHYKSCERFLQYIDPSGHSKIRTLTQHGFETGLS
jgi:DNA relaxase NicK